MALDDNSNQHVAGLGAKTNHRRHPQYLLGSEQRARPGDGDWHRLWLCRRLSPVALADLHLFQSRQRKWRHGDRGRCDCSVLPAGVEVVEEGGDGGGVEIKVEIPRATEPCPD